jgi:hypothetical protein
MMAPMTSAGEVALADLVFAVEQVSFSAVVSGDAPPEWYLSVHAAPRALSSETWQPHAYLERYRWDVRSWADMVARPIRIADGKALSGGRIVPGVELCALHVFEHAPLANVEIGFDSLGEGWFDLTWTATCDVCWNERYGRGLPFSVRAPVVFTGFWTDGVTEGAARARVGRHFDASETVFAEEQRRGGGWLLSPAAWEARRVAREGAPKPANVEEMVEQSLADDDEAMLQSVIAQPGADLEALIANAAVRGAERCVRLLDAAGAPIRAVVGSGQTLMHLAARSGNAGLIAYLVERGLEIDARTSTGSTPLMMAAGGSSTAAVAALLDAGADPSLTNGGGFTALDSAHSNGRAGTAALLAERFAANVRRDRMRHLATPPIDDFVVDDIVVVWTHLWSNRCCAPEACSTFAAFTPTPTKNTSFVWQPTARPRSIAFFPSWRGTRSGRSSGPRRWRQATPFSR